MHINWGKVNSILNFYTIKNAGCIDYYNNNIENVFTDEEFTTIKKMIKTNKLLLEMRTN